MGREWDSEGVSVGEKKVTSRVILEGGKDVAGGFSITVEVALRAFGANYEVDDLDILKEHVVRIYRERMIRLNLVPPDKYLPILENIINGVAEKDEVSSEIQTGKLSCRMNLLRYFVDSWFLDNGINAANRDSPTRGDFARAILYLSLVTQEDAFPLNPDAHYWMGLSYMNLGIVMKDRGLLTRGREELLLAHKLMPCNLYSVSGKITKIDYILGEMVVNEVERSK